MLPVSPDRRRPLLLAVLASAATCLALLTAAHYGLLAGIALGLCLSCAVALIWAGKQPRQSLPEPEPEPGPPSDVLIEFIRMIVRTVDERTAYLRGHSERVSRYSALIAGELRISPAQTERIRLAALLHDIGTLGIDDSVIGKSAPLTPEEFEIVKAHTVKGASILRPIESLSDLVPGVELHHESLDGSGYPYGLQRDQIPMMARIISVADSFDAMTTPRPYQPAMDPDYVLEVMGRLAGQRYDESAVAALSMLLMSGKITIEPRMARSEVRQGFVAT